MLDRHQSTGRWADDLLTAGLKQAIGAPSTVGRVDVVALADGATFRDIATECLQPQPDVAAVAAEAEKERQGSLGALAKVGEAISGKNKALSRPFEKKVEDARKARDAEVAKRSRLFKSAQEGANSPTLKQGPYILASIALLLRERCREPGCRVLLFSSLIDGRSAFAMSADTSQPADLAKDHAGYVAKNIGPLNAPADLVIRVWGFGRNRDGISELESNNRGKLIEYWKAAISTSGKGTLTISSSL